MKKFIISLVALVVLSVASIAQPSHVGILYSASGSDGKDGNGLLQGVAFQWSVDAAKASGFIPRKLEPLKFVGELKFSRDFKGYLNETGSAVRYRFLGRYPIPKGQGLFLQAGMYHGHISFNDTSVLLKNGYEKSATQALIGAGYDLQPFANLGATLDYLYFPKADLTAKSSTAPNPVRDGSTISQRVGLNLHMEPFPYTHPKWSLIWNVSGQFNTYQRDCALYGQALCGVKHNSKSYEIQMGIARRF